MSPQLILSTPLRNGQPIHAHHAPGAGLADEIVDRIQRGLAKLGRNDGQAVATMIAVGVHLVDLQDATRTKRDWTQRVKLIAIGTRPGRFLLPRTARRYQELGASRWGEGNGTPGSAILDLLPTDLQKLTWLCRLSHEQLEALLEEMDCKAASRKHVIDAVKAMLSDLQSKPTCSVPLDKAVQSFKRAVLKTAAALKMSDPEVADPADVRLRLHQALDEALAESHWSERDNSIQELFTRSKM